MTERCSKSKQLMADASAEMLKTNSLGGLCTPGVNPSPPAHPHLSSLHTSCRFRYSKLMARAAEGCWYTSRARNSRSSRLLRQLRGVPEAVWVHGGQRQQG